MALEDLKATVEDFVEIFGELEAIELSNINIVEGDEDAPPAITEERIQSALNLSFSEIMSYDGLCGVRGKYAIRKSLKRLMIDIARYRLDSLERRQDVVDTYERILEFFRECREDKGYLKISKAESEELELSEFLTSRAPTVKRGRIAFTDEFLEQYRRQSFYK